MPDPELPDRSTFNRTDAEFLIGPVRVCVARGLLEAPDGRREQLEPRVMQVLVELAARAGEVVSRRTLEQAVWSGMVVSDDALNRCIYRLRHAFDALLTDAHFGHVIETLRKRGYRLRLPVGSLDADAPRAAAGAAFSRHRTPRLKRAAWLVAPAAIALFSIAYVTSLDIDPPQSTPVSLAVLPFLNLTDDPGLDRIADGFAEQLLHDLANVPELRVAARTSSFFFKHKPLEANAIADRMNVDLLIEGSLRRQRDRIRVTVQLIDRSGFHVWSGEFNRSIGDSLGLQSDISRSVLDALGWRSAGQPIALPSESIASFNAYDKYLRGRIRLAAADDEALNDAKELFHQALELEPEYARAVTGLADAWSLAIWRRLEDRGLASRAAARAIDRALGINPRLAEAHASRGLLHLCRNEYQQAEAPLRRAIELNPNTLNAHIWLGLSLVYQDRFTEGVHAYLHAQTLDPMDAGLNRNLGANLLITGQVEAGFSYLRRAVEIDPSSPINYQLLSGWNRVYGRLEQALIWANRGLELDPENPAAMEQLATTLLQLGKFDESKSAFDTAWSLNPGAPSLLSSLFSLYLATDDRRALDALLARRDVRDGRFGQARVVLRWELIQALLDGDFQGAIALAEAGKNSDAMTCNAFMEPGPRLYYAHALRQSGDHSEADAVVRECADLLRRTRTNGGRHPDLAYRAALIAVLAGDLERASEELDAAIADGWRKYWQAWNDPLWRGVRTRPEFRRAFETARSRIVNNDVGNDAGRLESFSLARGNYGFSAPVAPRRGVAVLAKGL